ncbi:hypothetical protein BGX26_008568, partial [Mortierella sp. AD094]
MVLYNIKDTTVDDQLVSNLKVKLADAIVEKIPSRRELWMASFLHPAHKDLDGLTTLEHVDLRQCVLKEMKENCPQVENVRQAPRQHGNKTNSFARRMRDFKRRDDYISGEIVDDLDHNGSDEYQNYLKAEIRMNDEDFEE